jgi:4-hydroxy-tetrahydrodipicolinate synthase
MHYDELRKNLKGVVHLVMTPVTADEEIDYNVLRELVEGQVKRFEGNDCVFLAGGSTAEFYAFTDDMFKKYVDVMVKAVNGKFPLVVGTSRAGTKYSIKLSQYAESAGADGIMVVNTYYHSALDECVYDHYKAIAESVKCGVVIYNNPTTTKLYIYPDIMARLSKIPNIVGLKENTDRPQLFYRMYKSIDPADMTVFTGLAEPFFQYTALHGSRAFVTELANYLPQKAFAIYDAAKREDYKALTEIIASLDPLEAFKGRVASRQNVSTTLTTYLPIGGASVYQSVVKEAMKMVGFPIGKVMRPMYNLSPKEIDELREIMKGLGAI